MTDAEFIKIAESWLGTPWKHFQRIKGGGVDCAWYVLEVAKQAGMVDKAVMLEWYPQDWAQHNADSGVIKVLKDYAVQVPIDNIRTADVLVYKYGRCASHVGYYIADRIGIHSDIRRGVSKFRLTEMESKFHSVWRFKGAI